jgi:hypothetical protein
MNGGMNHHVSIKQASSTARFPVYPKFSIYRENTAFTLGINNPSFAQIPTGGGRTVVRPGKFVISLAKRMDKDTPSDASIDESYPRTYDWNRKGIFFMGVVDCGEFLDKSAEGFVITRDFKSGSSTLTFHPRVDSKGMTLTLNVEDKIHTIGTTYEIDMTWAEIEVVKCLMQASIPGFLGFNHFEEA